MRHTIHIAPFAPRRRYPCLAVVALLGGIGCSGSNVTCPQVLVVAGPAVVITSVTNKQTGAPISQFTLSNFTISGDPVGASGVVSGVPGTNATLGDGVLTCSGSCGFGGTEGAYTFTVSAAGRPDTTLAVSAKYAGSTGRGCSFELKDGTQVAVTI